MKLILKHLNHEPSASLRELVQRELEALQPDLQVDEARVHLERRLEASPPFRVSCHLVTPGPDVIAESADHTLRAALLKAFAGLREKISHRHQKRTRRHSVQQVTAAPRRVAPAGGRR